jgi:hypothetical protein
VLRETDLRVPILWMLDTDRVELGIVARADRDYAKAADYFSKVPQAHLMAEYAACRAQGRASCQ